MHAATCGSYSFRSRRSTQKAHMVGYWYSKSSESQIHREEAENSLVDTWSIIVTFPLPVSFVSRKHNFSVCRLIKYLFLTVLE
jgi:hypothetical protein